METYTVYVANDGKEFRSEEECLKHEDKLSINKLVKVVKIINSCGCDLTLTPNDWNCATCIYFNGTPDDAHTFNCIWNEYNSEEESPLSRTRCKLGLYLYFTEIEGYRNIDTYLESLTDRKEQYKKLLGI